MYELPENRVTTIGRSSQNAIQITNPGVSRFHAEMAYVNGVWELRDLNSKHGTLVNGEPIGESRALNPGDVVRLSTTVLRFDRVDKGLSDDEALLAVIEAEIDERIRKESSRGDWLDKVVKRSRLESLERREGPRPRYPTGRNVAFLLLVLLLCAAVVGGVLFHRRRVEARAGRGRRPAAGRRATNARREELWKRVEAALDRVDSLEAEGDYEAALAVYEEVQDLNATPPARKLLDRRRQQTRELARAAFEGARERAERMLELGQPGEAARLWRRTAERVGLDDLSRRAIRRAEELEKEETRG